MTILLFVAIWAVVPMALAFLCLFLPDRFFDPALFFWSSHAFEKNGQFYERIFHVRNWKRLLPDGGNVWKKHGYQKKNLSDFSEENLHRFLIESSRGELVHWLGILPFWVFGFFAPPDVIWIMLAYALIVNAPCIIAQRYNRPRIYELYKRRYPEKLK